MRLGLLAHIHVSKHALMQLKKWKQMKLSSPSFHFTEKGNMAKRT